MVFFSDPICYTTSIQKVPHRCKRPGRGQPKGPVIMTSIPQKTCTKCGVQKPLLSFSRNTASLDGHRRDCKQCQADTTFESRRRKKWQERYGITPEDYAYMLQSQGGVCAICKRSETGRSNTGGTRLLAVDHCHSTGAVRGLLCNRCNRSLGVLEDTEWRKAAADYLEKHGK